MYTLTVQMLAFWYISVKVSNHRWYLFFNHLKIFWLITLATNWEHPSCVFPFSCFPSLKGQKVFVSIGFCGISYPPSSFIMIIPARPRGSSESLSWNPIPLAIYKWHWTTIILDLATFVCALSVLTLVCWDVNREWLYWRKEILAACGV